MITLNRDYFTQKVSEAKAQLLKQEIYVNKCKSMGKIDESQEKLLDDYSWKYRLAKVNLKRFDLGRLVKVDGVGYISNYSKS